MAAREHTCVGNDHIGLIALAYDFFGHEVLWEANAGLGRRDPNVLYTTSTGGDVVRIPGKVVREEAVEAGKTHTFVVPTVRVWLRLRIVRDDFEPVKGAEYELDFAASTVGVTTLKEDGWPVRLNVDGQALPLTGKTDEDGLIEHEVPVRLETAYLSVRLKAEDARMGGKKSRKKPGDGSLQGEGARWGDVPVSWSLKVGNLNPVKEEAPNEECISGIQQRLNNLNINAGPVDGIYGPNTRAAIAAFQKLYRLSVPKGHEGEPNEVTRDKLYEIHDQTEADPRPPEARRK